MQHYNEWPTKEQDIQTMTEIAEKYLKANWGEPLGLFNVLVDREKDKVVDIELAPWFKEVQVNLRKRYGYEHGEAIAALMMTEMLLHGETVH